MFLGVCLPVRPLAQLSPAPGPSTAQHSARLGAKAVQIGFRLGSDWVQSGFRLGSDWVQIGFRLGSDLARLGAKALGDSRVATGSPLSGPRGLHSSSPGHRNPAQTTGKHKGTLEIGRISKTRGF